MSGDSYFWFNSTVAQVLAAFIVFTLPMYFYIKRSFRNQLTQHLDIRKINYNNLFGESMMSDIFSFIFTIYEDRYAKVGSTNINTLINNKIAQVHNQHNNDIDIIVASIRKYLLRYTNEQEKLEPIVNDLINIKSIINKEEKEITDEDDKLLFNSFNEIGLSVMKFFSPYTRGVAKRVDIDKDLQNILYQIQNYQKKFVNETKYILRRYIRIEINDLIEYTEKIKHKTNFYRCIISAGGLLACICVSFSITNIIYRNVFSCLLILFLFGTITIFYLLMFILLIIGIIK